MAVSERVDIVKEIKSEMLELQNEGKTPQEILERLGNARELARAYLGRVSPRAGVQLAQIQRRHRLYSMAGAVGFVLPVTSICAAAFLLSGAPVPSGRGWSNLWGLCWALRCPISEFNWAAIPPARLVLVLSVVMGAVVMAAGWLLWKLTVWMIRSMALGHKKAGPVRATA